MGTSVKGNSVKGLFKGLRYISQIFDEKEQEMQIGLPTDVKHVAHIGWDGPSGNQNTPTWMNDFKSSPQAKTSSDLANSMGELDLSSANIPTQESGELGVQKANRARKSKPQTSSESSLDSSSARRNSEKASRRQRSSCPSGDSQEDSSRSSRRRRGSNQGAESGSENPAPKHSHRRKSKGSSDGGESTKSSRSSDNNSLTDIPLPVLEAVEEKE